VSERLVAVVGTDATMVNDAVVTVVDELLGGLDPSMALEDFVAGATPDVEDGAGLLARVLEALNTPPFIVPSRVVVVRDAQHLAREDADALLAWAEHPLEGVWLVVASSSERARGPLVKAAGRVLDVSVGRRDADKVRYVLAAFESHEVRITSAVAEQIVERLGEEFARVDPLARSLRATFGAAQVSFEQVAPYLGDAGDVPEWDLTDAVDQGRVSDAIVTARRMLDSEGRVGVQVTNILQRHYLKLARLEGSGASSGEAAASIVGGHPFPAQKLVSTARILGPDRVAAAVALVARADLDLKGGANYGGTSGGVDRTALTVIEVLVARLARLSADARRR
jgi:DNA polymerase-3 subunit delta